MTDTQHPWVVLKFGGTSVSSRANWNTIAHVMHERKEAGFRPFVVCSAMARISRMLDRLLNEAVRGQRKPVLEEVRARHRELGTDLELNADELLAPYYEELDRLTLGASLTQEVSPRLRARVLAMGELMATTLGTEFLKAQGLGVRWHDARTLLQADEVPRRFEHRRYLEAICDAQPDAALQDALDDTTDFFLTQGFIARDTAGDTVLLGWGGSDTSAAYFAGKLAAQRLEIWTDVPGMFTANPRKITTARHVRRLGYDEAQELATTGAEVLHPRCIDPVRRQQIPLHIRCTQAPHLEGTIVAGTPDEDDARVKAISPKKGLTVIAIDTTDMWQEVGFLAGVFNTLKDHNLSVDLIATSETNITFSLDRTADALDPTTIQALLRDLEAYGQTRAIGPCAAVSLVGRHLRAILPDLGTALRLANEQHIYLMAQAASDINLTFVVDEAAADALTQKLHAQLFDGVLPDDLFGATWEELFASPEQTG